MTTHHVPGGAKTVVSAPDSSDAENVIDLSDSADVFFGGRYELLDLLGAGGAGTVYRARDNELDEIIALKILRKEWLKATAGLDSFRSEVKLARRVTHRNVARMFDLGEHDGERYLTMEYVDGPMLSVKLLPDPTGHIHPLPLPEVAQITTQLTAGLTAAHEKGIVHRDLKRCRTPREKCPVKCAGEFRGKANRPCSWTLDLCKGFVRVDLLVMFGWRAQPRC